MAERGGGRRDGGFVEGVEASAGEDVGGGVGAGCFCAVEEEDLIVGGDEEDTERGGGG